MVESGDGAQKGEAGEVQAGSREGLHSEPLAFTQSMKMSVVLDDLFSSSSAEEWSGWEETWREGE